MTDPHLPPHQQTHQQTHQQPQQPPERQHAAAAVTAVTLAAPVADVVALLNAITADTRALERRVRDLTARLEQIAPLAVRHRFLQVALLREEARQEYVRVLSELAAINGRMACAPPAVRRDVIALLAQGGHRWPLRPPTLTPLARRLLLAGTD